MTRRTENRPAPRKDATFLAAKRNELLTCMSCLNLYVHSSAKNTATVDVTDPTSAHATCDTLSVAPLRSRSFLFIGVSARAARSSCKKASVLRGGCRNTCIFLRERTRYNSLRFFWGFGFIREISLQSSREVIFFKVTFCPSVFEANWWPKCLETRTT